MTDNRLRLAVIKHLRDLTVDVTLEVGPGVTTVVGPSGAGKTSLIRMVAGLLHPDMGTVHLGGMLLDDAMRPYHLPPGRRGLSVVFQEYALFPHLSVEENVAYGLQAHRVSRRERHLRVTGMLERLGIAALAHERPGHLSGGQRQRVALARALVLQPRALLLDEPLAALDAQTRSQVRHELRAILADLSIPTVLITHDYADALMFRDRIVVIDGGRIVQDGPHASLLAHPRSRFVAEFTGVNFFEGILLGDTSEPVRQVRVEGGMDVYVTAEGVPAGSVSLALHPWEVIVSHEPPMGSTRNVLKGWVRDIIHLGGRVRLLLGVGPEEGVPMIAEITHEAQATLHCREGQVLYVSFKATALRVNSLSGCR